MQDKYLHNCDPDLTMYPQCNCTYHNLSIIDLHPLLSENICFYWNIKNHTIDYLSKACLLQHTCAHSVFFLQNKTQVWASIMIKLTPNLCIFKCMVHHKCKNRVLMDQADYTFLHHHCHIIENLQSFWRFQSNFKGTSADEIGHKSITDKPNH